MRGPNYSALTGVTAVLVTVAVFRLAFQSQIPPPHPDIAHWGRGEFVVRGKDQDVKWRALGPKAFAESQRLSRPVFIVIGVPWSALGRQADETFSSPDVARALNQGFIPIRIDAAQDPQWLSEFLPLQRAQSGFSVGFQAWVFDLKGHLIDFLGRLNADDSLNQQAMVVALVRAQDRFARAALADSLPDLEVSQRADADRFQESGISNLSLSEAASNLSDRLDPQWGGWNVRGLLVSRPLTIHFLQLAGMTDQAGTTLRRLALSPRADWLDGGFYRVFRSDNRIPEYDKVAVTNAQLAETLAVQDALHPDALLKQAARRTVDWLLGTRLDGLFVAAEQGDEDERGRSERASFTPRRLREAVRLGNLSAENRSWAESLLGLDGSQSDALLAFPNQPETVESHLDRFNAVLEQLRKSAGEPRTKAGIGLADVNGSVAACLLRIARLWGDAELAAAAGEIVDHLDPFLANRSLRHSLFASSAETPYLGDSLAFADASMEDFLTNGRVPSLERGALVLREALKTFRGPVAGLLCSSPASAALLTGRPSLPQVTDDEREACSAMALRLLTAYATVLGPDGVDFDREAMAAASRLSAVTDGVPSMGGALSALARHGDTRAAFVVGDDALSIAGRLTRRLPHRLIVPVLGPARRDLRKRSPGIYLWTPGGCTGPWSENDAVERLAGGLQVGL